MCHKFYISLNLFILFTQIQDLIVEYLQTHFKNG